MWLTPRLYLDNSEGSCHRFRPEVWLSVGRVRDQRWVPYRDWGKPESKPLSHRLAHFVGAELHDLWQGFVGRRCFLFWSGAWVHAIRLLP
jgi:hypothetical protein